jgi:transposase
MTGRKTGQYLFPGRGGPDRSLTTRNRDAALKLHISGYAKQSDIIRAFGVTKISVKRSVKLYREKGTRGFYAPRVTRGAAVLVDGVVEQVEELLAGGASAAEATRTLGVKRNTLEKAIRAGRIRAPIKKNSPTVHR